MQYCLACFSDYNELKVIGGDDYGVLATFSVLSTGRIKDPDQDFHFDVALKGGHRESVGCFLQWRDAMWVTAGEDGRICFWINVPPEESSISSEEEDTSRVATRDKRPRRMKPY